MNYKQKQTIIKVLKAGGAPGGPGWQCRRHRGGRRPSPGPEPAVNPQPHAPGPAHPGHGPPGRWCPVRRRHCCRVRGAAGGASGRLPGDPGRCGRPIQPGGGHLRDSQHLLRGWLLPGASGAPSTTDSSHSLPVFCSCPRCGIPTCTRLGTVHVHPLPAPLHPQSVSPRGWCSPPNGGTPPRASGPSLPVPSPAPRTQRLTRLRGHLRDAARRGCDPRQGQEHTDTTRQQVQGTKTGAEPGGVHMPIQLTISRARSGGPGTRQGSELLHREDWEAEAGNCFRVNKDDQGNKGSWHRVPGNRLNKFFTSKQR